MAFPRNLFFYWYYFYFLEILVKDLDLFSWNLDTFTKHKEQICFLFICSFFACCFVIILCIVLHFFVLFHGLWTHRVSLLFLLVVLQSLYVITLSTFCTWTGSLKRTSKWTFQGICLPCQFPWWSLNILKIRLTSAEIRMSKLSKSDIRTNSPCCSLLLWISFCFLQVNQGKCVGMVSTNI